MPKKSASQLQKEADRLEAERVREQQAQLKREFLERQAEKAA